MVRRVDRERSIKDNDAERRLGSLFDQVSDLLKTTKQKDAIHLIRPDASNFEGITVNMPDGDQIELGVEKRGWFNSRRTHGDRVLIGITGNVKPLKGEEWMAIHPEFHQQFMIEKYGVYTFIHYANTFRDNWNRVESWPNDPKNYVGFLEKLVAAGKPRAGYGMANG